MYDIKIRILYNIISIVFVKMKNKINKKKKKGMKEFFIISIWNNKGLF